MDSARKNEPRVGQAPKERPGKLKAYVEGAESALHPEHDELQVGGARRIVDRQNNLVDQHNQRK